MTNNDTENQRLRSELAVEREKVVRFQEAIAIAIMVVERAYGKDPRPEGSLLEDWGLEPGDYDQGDTQGDDQ